MGQPYTHRTASQVLIYALSSSNPDRWQIHGNAVSGDSTAVALPGLRSAQRRSFDI
ncbi:hypothetical protein [Paraburkholderia caffeinilytica]|uniref:hypothetical protein n=1 Tax=Paraburkholderia caffeinilytica TaxID=1761016 RepID=UPI0038BD5783